MLIKARHVKLRHLLLEVGCVSFSVLSSAHRAASCSLQHTVIPTCKGDPTPHPLRGGAGCSGAACARPLTKAPALWVERSVAPGCSSATALPNGPSAPQELEFGEQRMGKMPLLLYALNARYVWYIAALLILVGTGIVAQW